MPTEDQNKWDERYRNRDVERPSPARVLADYRYLLPGKGRALDVAGGRGGNALLLAESGLTTHAWDMSGVAIELLEKHAQELKLTVKTRVCDLTVERPEESSFDVIVVSNYLDRELTPFLCRALTENGLLFYETFITEKIDETGPRNPALLLHPNELLLMFSDLHILLYREDGLTGNPTEGIRNKAMLIGQNR